MLVTRPEPDASETVARLGALGIEGIACPLMTHETLDVSLPDPRGFAAMAVTSANALRSLAERGVLERYQHLPLYAVGDRTAMAASGFGFTDVKSAHGTFTDLVELLSRTPVDGPIFYPAPREPAGDLPKSLAPYGRLVIATALYAMNPVTSIPEAVLAQIEKGEIGAVLVYSLRTAETFAALTTLRLNRRVRAQLGVLCLSETVAGPLIDAHFVRIGLADHPSEEAMMGLALSFARDQNVS